MPNKCKNLFCFGSIKFYWFSCLKVLAKLYDKLYETMIEKHFLFLYLTDFDENKNNIVDFMPLWVIF